MLSKSKLAMNSQPFSKALAASVVLHICLFIIAGLFCKDIFSRESKYIELDLVSAYETEIGGGGGGGSGEEKFSQPQQQTQSHAVPSTGNINENLIGDTENITESKDMTPNINENVSSNQTANDSTMTSGSGLGSGGIGTGSGTGIGSGSGSGSGNGSGSGSGDGSGRGEKGISPPRVLSMNDPEYPSSARKNGYEGKVIVKVEVLSSGYTGDCWIAKSSGYSILDESALSAVRNWRFVPAKDRATGETIACVTSVPIIFELN